jgi:hypothetical protein
LLSGGGCGGGIIYDNDTNDNIIILYIFIFASAGTKSDVFSRSPSKVMAFRSTATLLLSPTKSYMADGDTSPPHFNANYTI